MWIDAKTQISKHSWKKQEINLLGIHWWHSEDWGLFVTLFLLIFQINFYPGKK